MKLTLKSLLAVAALAFAGIGCALTASPAHAVVTCTAATGTQYPYVGADGNSYARLCFNDTSNRRAEVFNSVKGLPGIPKQKLEAAKTIFFFFNTRADAIEYFNGTLPYNLFPINTGKFADSKTRCGNTGFFLDQTFGQVYNVSMVYNYCTLDQTPGVAPAPLLNPALKRTTIHEAGHAFDNALAAVNSSVSVPSKRSGFLNLFEGDKQVLTPANWSQAVGSTPKMTQTQRYNYMCNLFSTPSPSALERDFGATLNGGPVPPAVATGRVCETVSLPFPYYQTKTPTEAATEKLPYWMSDSRELWAEAFLITLEGSQTVPTFLPMVDRVIGMNQSPTRSFNCTRRVVQEYITTGLPPSAATLALIGCPQNPGPL